MKKMVAIVQSSYIPWKGFFDLMDRVDEFIIFDDVQFTRRDWRNRNKIKTSTGEAWLTIPINQKGNFYQPINETKVMDGGWASKHWKSILLNYGKADFFKDYKNIFAELYHACENEEYISQVNYKFIVKIAELLGIKTKITWSTDYKIDTNLRKTERLIALCQQAKATDYLSGPSAKSYIQEDLFIQAKINLHYMNYAGYKLYPQLFGDFIHQVSVIDLLFNTGREAYSYIKPSDAETIS